MARGPFLCFLLFALIPCAERLEAAVSDSARQALIALYDSTGGHTWLDQDGWRGSPGTECSWSGVTCDDSGGAIIGIALARNNLAGELPDAIGDLSSLRELDLSGNRLTGPVPSSIGDLEALRSLRLCDNELTLPLPPSLVTLASLETLDLSGNRLDGPFPAEISGMSELTSVDLSYNALRGEVPPTISSLASLEDGRSDFRFNALSATEPSVQVFLDQKQTGGDWSSSQTVPPDDPSLEVSGILWTPIAFSSGPGHYRLDIHTEGGDPVAVFSTGSKASSSYRLTADDVVGFLVATIYTISSPHGRQKNLVVSEPSVPLDFSILGYAPDFPFFAFGVRPEPLIQIGGVQQNSPFFTVVNYGGLGGDALLEQTGDFFTLSDSVFFIDAFSTERIDVASVTRPPGEYEGEVQLTGEGLFEPLSLPISLISLPAPPDADGEPEERRLDLVSGRSVLRSSTVFRNDGQELLSGMVTSDVPWIVPVTETVSILPGETALIEFDVDPDARLDSFSEEGVSFSGTLRVVYADEIEVGGKGIGPRDQHTTGVSTTLATVVSTVPPTVTEEAIPALGETETGFLLSGLEHEQNVFSDVAIANAFGSLTVADLRAFFASAGQTGSAQMATFEELRRRSAISLGAPVRTVFDRPAGAGAIQFRSAGSDSVLVSARRLHAVGARGLYGTALPVFSSDRLAEPGESVYITGLGVAATADLFIQSGDSAGATVTIQILDAQGEILETIQGVLAGWDSAELENVAPSEAATAVVSNDPSSGGPITVWAMLWDDEGNDPWVEIDWHSYWGEPYTTPVLIPVARHEGPARPTGARRRVVRRPGMSIGTRTGVDLTLFNASSATSAGLLTLHESNGEIAEEIVVLEPRETRMLRDVVGTTFGRSGSRDGHLRLEPLRGELVASARLVTVSEEGTIGSTIPVHPRGAGLRLGQRRSIATVDDSRRKTIEESIPATWTTRFRLLETSGHEAVVRATIHVATGSMLAAARVSRDFEVGADQMLPLGQIGEAIMGEAREIGVDDLHDLLVDFVVVEGEGAVLVITESIENGTGDLLIRFD